MGIEEIDKKYIKQLKVDPKKHLTQDNVEEVVNFLDLKNDSQKDQMRKVITNLYKCFIENDSTLLEINPLGITTDERVLICDSKINIDDNSFIRHKDLFKLEDQTQRDALEILAEKYELNYVKLDGDIGCMVNGAGLAMATMDLINFRGGSPANFLDIGGGSDKESIK